MGEIFRYLVLDNALPKHKKVAHGYATDEEIRNVFSEYDSDKYNFYRSYNSKERFKGLLFDIDSHGNEGEDSLETIQEKIDELSKDLENTHIETEINKTGRGFLVIFPVEENPLASDEKINQIYKHYWSKIRKNLTEKYGLQVDEQVKDYLRVVRVVGSTNTNVGTKCEIYKLIKGKLVDVSEKVQEEIQEDYENQVRLSATEILKKENPNEQERVACVMKIFEANRGKGWKGPQVFNFIDINNKWKNYNASITRDKIEKYVSKYFDKPKPDSVAAKLEGALDELEDGLSLENLEKQLILRAPSLVKGELPKYQWILDKKIPTNSVNFLAGPPGVAKSFIAMYLGYCAACKEKFLSKFDVRSGPVLYIDEEMGLQELQRRAKLIEGGLGIEGDESKDLLLMSFKDFSFGKEWTEALDLIVNKYKPILIIIDSLIRAFKGDENSAKETKEIFNCLKTISNKYQTSFLIIHHTRKTEEDADMGDMRGSSELAAAASSILVMTRKSDNTYTMTHVKNRCGGATTKKIRFEIKDSYSKLFDKDMVSFNFIGEEDDTEEKEKLENLKTSIVEYAEVRREEGFKGKKIASDFPLYGRRTVYRAISELIDENILERKGYGIYKFKNPDPEGLSE